MALMIELWRIPVDGGQIEGEEAGEILDLGESGDVAPAGPVAYSLHVQYVTGELLVQGSVSTKVRYRCSRCADLFVREVRDDEFFCEREVENLHSTVDLTDELRESMILAFSSFPVCRESCLGLCPHCGANRNKKKCGCKEPEEERWSAFDGLGNIEVNNGSTQTEEVKKSNPDASKK
jgi:uncharacterized protein